MQKERYKTFLKLRIVPFLKTLDLSFFARLAFFAGILYYCHLRMKDLPQHLHAVEESQDDEQISHRFSKTFGHEKKLDSILR